MRTRKQTKEERKLNLGASNNPKESERPIDDKDLEALLEHFGQIKNLPK